MPTALAQTGQRAAAGLKSRFGGKIIELSQGAGDVIVTADPSIWKSLHLILREFGFDMLMSIAAVDFIKESRMEVVTHLYASEKRQRISAKTSIGRANPRIESLSGVWPAADWHEREAFDLSGVIFTGHPNLKRILCPDDWEGHPLRKDYEQPKYYHGIPNTIDLIDPDKPQMIEG